MPIPLTLFNLVGVYPCGCPGLGEIHGCPGLSWIGTRIAQDCQDWLVLEVISGGMVFCGLQAWYRPVDPAPYPLKSPGF